MKITALLISVLLLFQSCSRRLYRDPLYYLPQNLSAEGAKQDIAQNKLMFICGGGFLVQAFSPGDKAFEKEFGIQYLLLDCRVPPFEQTAAYNKEMAAYLDSRYDTAWRSKLRHDVHGISRKSGSYLIQSER
jgi:hypothetical protein